MLYKNNYETPHGISLFIEEVYETYCQYLVAQYYGSDDEVIFYIKKLINIDKNSMCGGFYSFLNYYHDLSATPGGLFTKFFN